MKLKRFLAAALAAALCGGLWASPAARAAEAPAAAFTDVSDPQVAEAAELLRLLGVVSGDGTGRFYPDDQLTRAQFCRMAVDIRGSGDQAQAMMGYTYFSDVRGDHWARGYINYASRITVGESGERLVMGVGDGSFKPDVNIGFAEAVTMTLRLLGYSQQTVASGSTWYDGYLTTAGAVGLLEGLDARWDEKITRAQAAILFENLLFTSPNGGGEPFFTTLGGSQSGEVILLSTNATAADGTRGALKVTDGETTAVRKTDRVGVDPALAGSKVKLMLDKDGKVLAVKPVEGFSRRTVTLAEHEISYLTTAEGEKLSVTASADLYRGDEKTTYGAVYMDLRAGSRLSLCYSPSGELEYLYIAPADDTVDAVATRLTAIYEDASPSVKTPLEVTVLGARLAVLDSAVDEVAAFRPGDRITLLLTAEGKVAGATAAGQGGASLVGVVTAFENGAVTVSPVMELKDADGEAVTFSGKATLGEGMVGELVSVSSQTKGQISATRLTQSGARGVLDVKTRTLDGKPLAQRVYLYERTAGGSPQAISWSQLTLAAVPADKIAYAGTDEAGAVNVLIFNDVTGDGYTYGYLSARTETSRYEGDDYYVDQETNYVGVDSSAGAVEYRAPDRVGLKDGVPGGLIRNSKGYGVWVGLTELKSVPRSAFNSAEMTLTVGGTTYPVAQNVQCRNRSSGTWFASGREGMDAARAYSETLTVYYDKAPSQGGKIRLIVAG